MTPELVFLFFGRKVMLGFVPFWQQVLSPLYYVHMLDWSMSWIFGWHAKNMLLEDKIIFYQHLFSYTSVRQIVVSLEKFMNLLSFVALVPNHES